MSAAQLMAISVLAFVGGLIVGAGEMQLWYQKESIEHGYAHHDPITGKWQWNNEGEKK